MKFFAAVLVFAVAALAAPVPQSAVRKLILVTEPQVMGHILIASQQPQAPMRPSRP